MRIQKFNDMLGGWFVGDFTPSAFRTKDFEVCYKTHTKGEIWPTHYHKISTEINLLIDGKMIIQDVELNSGDIFILEPWELANPVFLEDCKLVIIKTPSSTNDKYEIQSII